MTRHVVITGASSGIGAACARAFAALGDRLSLGARRSERLPDLAEKAFCSELDVTVGWSGNVAEDWALDVNLTHYRYPSATVDLDWTEAIGTLTWKQNTWVQLGYSNDALATDEAGAYAQLGARFPLGEQVRLHLLGEILDPLVGIGLDAGAIGVFKVLGEILNELTFLFSCRFLPVGRQHTLGHAAEIETVVDDAADTRPALLALEAVPLQLGDNLVDGFFDGVGRGAGRPRRRSRQQQRQ